MKIKKKQQPKQSCYDKMTNIVQFKKWYAILFSYRGLGFHCIYVFLGSPKGLVKIITSMINLNSSQFFFLYRASTYRVKKPHNLILPLTKTNSCVRVHKISFMLYLIITLRSTCTWIYQELTSYINNIQEIEQVSIGICCMIQD